MHDLNATGLNPRLELKKGAFNSERHVSLFSHYIMDGENKDPFLKFDIIL
jgi:hypothetical protein